MVSDVHKPSVKHQCFSPRRRRLTCQSGPIIRINPFELHVSDPDFIDTLYTRSAPRDKHPYLTRAFGTDDVTFNTCDHAHHRLRRAAVAPFFSKQRVLGLQDLIWTHVEKLCNRFEEFQDVKKPLPTGNAFGCLTADIIIDYSMGIQQNALEDPDFAPFFTQAIKKFAEFAIILRHMPWMHKLINAIPPDRLSKLSPEYGAMLAFRKMNNDRVAEAFTRNEKRSVPPAAHNVFDELINSDLPPAEKTLSRLSQESQIIIDAAVDTTAHTLTTTLFHILDNPSKLTKLQHELRAAMPHPHTHAPLVELEKLPYFSAVINEGLRLSYGISSRNARIAHTPMVYKEWIIPAKTPVGMSVPLTHHNEDIFPDSHSFVPERWLDADGKYGAKTPDGRSLEKFLMAFGRGSRQCAGINLARAELYLCLAAVLRRFDMQLFESGRRDVDMVRDLFLPGVARESKGVRVLVK